MKTLVTALALIWGSHGAAMEMGLDGGSRPLVIDASTAYSVTAYYMKGGNFWPQSFSLKGYWGKFDDVEQCYRLDEINNVTKKAEEEANSRGGSLRSLWVKGYPVCSDGLSDGADPMMKYAWIGSVTQLVGSLNDVVEAGFLARWFDLDYKLALDQAGDAASQYRFLREKIAKFDWRYDGFGEFKTDLEEFNTHVRTLAKLGLLDITQNTLNHLNRLVFTGVTEYQDDRRQELVKNEQRQEDEVKTGMGDVHRRISAELAKEELEQKRRDQEAAELKKAAAEQVKARQAQEAAEAKKKRQDEIKEIQARRDAQAAELKKEAETALAEQAKALEEVEKKKQAERSERQAKFKEALQRQEAEKAKALADAEAKEQTDREARQQALESSRKRREEQQAELAKKEEEEARVAAEKAEKSDQEYRQKLNQRVSEAEEKKTERSAIAEAAMADLKAASAHNPLKLLGLPAADKGGKKSHEVTLGLIRQVVMANLRDDWEGWDNVNYHQTLEGKLALKVAMIPLLIHVIANKKVERHAKQLNVKEHVMLGMLAGELVDRMHSLLFDQDGLVSEQWLNDASSDFAIFYVALTKEESFRDVMSTLVRSSPHHKERLAAVFTRLNLVLGRDMSVADLLKPKAKPIADSLKGVVGKLGQFFQSKRAPVSTDKQQAAVTTSTTEAPVTAGKGKEEESEDAHPPVLERDDEQSQQDDDEALPPPPPPPEPEQDMELSVMLESIELDALRNSIEDESKRGAGKNNEPAGEVGDEQSVISNALINAINAKLRGARAREEEVVSSDSENSWDD